MLRKDIVSQALVTLVAPLVLGTAAFGDLITLTGAEQSVYTIIGYRHPQEIDNTVEERLFPDPPRGLVNANLNPPPLDHYGVTVSGSLTSTLFSPYGEDRVTASGSSTTSAKWGDQPVFDDPPDDANDVHGGAGSEIWLRFTTGKCPVHLSISGHFVVNQHVYPQLNPTDTSVSMELSGPTGIIKQISWDGQDITQEMAFTREADLQTKQNYLLHVLAKTGTHASEEHPLLHSREASFTLDMTWEKGSCIVPGVLTLTEAEAEIILANACLVKGDVTEEWIDLPIGSVIKQNPDEGQTVPCGSAVNLVISKGRAPEVMLAGTALFIMDEVDAGTIGAKLEGSLLAKVNAALAALDKGNPNAERVAINNLNALISKVEAQAGKKIESDVAAAIIEEADTVIAELGG